MRTTPPGGDALLVLYDGECRFCTRSAKQLAALRGSRHVTLLSFQEPGALERFPGVTHEACMQRLHVVFPDGRVYAGAEAVARVVGSIPLVGLPAFTYYVPGIRQASEAIYDLVAKNRYKIAGRTCEGGTCHLHMRCARATQTPRRRRRTMRPRNAPSDPRATNAEPGP